MFFKGDINSTFNTLLLNLNYQENKTKNKLDKNKTNILFTLISVSKL